MVKWNQTESNMFPMFPYDTIPWYRNTSLGEMFFITEVYLIINFNKGFNA